MDSTDSLHSCTSTALDLDSLDINSDVFNSKENLVPPVMSAGANAHNSGRTSASYPGASYGGAMASTQVTVSSDNVMRHSKYYIEDTMSVFLVGDKLFKVHRHFLARESEVFRWMFANNPQLEGTSDAHPIILSGVRPEEFESLLDFFYNGMHVHLGSTSPTSLLLASKRRQSPSFNPLSHTPPQHLFNLLSISTLYSFDRIRSYAIAAIQHLIPTNTLDPIDLILLGEKHDIFHWIAPSLAKLCQREKPLTIEEARKLGFETAILVAEAREVLMEVHGKVKRGEVQFDQGIVGRVLDEIFFKFDRVGVSGKGGRERRTSVA